MHFDELDDHLQSTQKFITGDQFTLADIYWMIIIKRLSET